MMPLNYWLNASPPSAAPLSLKAGTDARGRWRRAKGEGGVEKRALSRRLLLIFAMTGCVLAGRGQTAERVFDFSQFPLHQAPPGFRSTVSGLGKPGEWQIIREEAPPRLPPLASQAPPLTQPLVLAQLARDPTDEHFPLLIFEEENFADFTLTTRFKTVSGEREQMAGIAFRLQDEKNYYVVRASSLGNTFRFYKVVDGIRGEPVGTNVVIATNTWHELSVECRGNRIRFRLDGKPPIPEATDYTFTRGKFGFWTKSDSVSYFADTRIEFTPREPLAQVLVRDQLKRYPRLLGLKIFILKNTPPIPHIIASDQAREVGQKGGKPEEDVITRDVIYSGKRGNTHTVTLPLHDRNGESVAAVRVVLKAFPGQTEQNAIARALPIVKAMERRVRSKSDLTE